MHLHYRSIFHRESFHELYPFEAHFIHLKRSIDRMENIAQQKSKLSVPVHIFDAVEGKQLDLQQMVSDGLIEAYYVEMYKNPSIYGCYQSHARLLASLLEKHKKGELKSKYSFIMEDDVQLLSDDFTNELASKIQVASFDMMMVGHGGNHQGIPIKDNVFHMNTSSFLIGAYAYVVSHDALERIVPLLTPMSEAIDWQYVNLAKAGKIHMTVVSPVMVDPGTMESTIGH